MKETIIPFDTLKRCHERDQHKVMDILKKCHVRTDPKGEIYDMDSPHFWEWAEIWNPKFAQSFRDWQRMTPKQKAEAKQKAKFSSERWRREEGPKKWAELHQRSWTIKTIVPGKETEWLEKFERTIPCGECKAHWHQVVVENPPDFSSHEAYFRWTVDCHNLVNRSLGKPLMSYEDAETIWRHSI